MYKIVKAPNPSLSQVAKKVTKIDENIKKIVSEMIVTLESARDPEGVGLAAPQVGKSLQIFVIKESRKSPILTIINPTIEGFTDRKVRKKKTAKEKSLPAGRQEEDVKLEGCLSLQDIWGVVNRHEAVALSYTDLDGKKHRETFTGFLATIIQHECDHLQGILFPKRVLEQQGTLYKSKKNAEGETVFSEITI